MSTELVGLAVTILGTAIGATWTLRNSLSGIEIALREHIAENKAEHKTMDARIVKLEGRRRR